MSPSPTPTERRSADISPADFTADGFLITNFVVSLTNSQRDQPQIVPLSVAPWFLDPTLRPADVGEGTESPADITIRLAVTSIRQTWPTVEDDDPDAERHRSAEWYQWPEFEFEGWLVNLPGQTGPDKRQGVAPLTRTC